MRKKSHISLARHIVADVDSLSILKHKKAFYVGSILPDCKPSFITTKHEIEGTFPRLTKELDNIVSNRYKMQSNYYRHLGEIMHYIADYFTFPHNKVFLGNMREHCAYEAKLKFTLNDYMRGIDALPKRKDDGIKLMSSEDICNYIRARHAQYIQCVRHTVEEDCNFIVEVCTKIATAIMTLCGANRVALGLA